MAAYHRLYWAGVSSADISFAKLYRPIIKGLRESIPAYD